MSRMIPTGQVQILGTSGSAGSLTVPPGNGTTLWAVDFNGPTRRRHIHDLRRLILRHLYATATGVSTDNTALTVTKDYPVLPPMSPEAAITSTQSLPILADANNGMLFLMAKPTPPFTISALWHPPSLASTYASLRAIRSTAHSSLSASGQAAASPAFGSAPRVTCCTSTRPAMS